jgi:hypothetical protein
MPTFHVPDNFTVTDDEFTESKSEQEKVYRDEGGRQAGRSYLDALGHARWDTDYVTLRMAGYSHQSALQEMRVRIREAWNPPLPPIEAHVDPPAPQPGPDPAPPAGLLVGPGDYRAPNPAPGTVLLLPDYGQAVVESVARVFPHFLAASCQPDGGSWDFMDWVVDTLRTHDSRWGYNGKRGDAADPSMDAIAYNRGRHPDAGTTEVYIVDVVGGHCGPLPRPAWHDVTEETLAAGTIGRWISRGRF